VEEVVLFDIYFLHGVLFVSCHTYVKHW